MKKLNPEQIKKAVDWVNSENQRYDNLMKDVIKDCDHGFHDWNFDHWVTNRTYYQKCSKCGATRLEF